MMDTKQALRHHRKEKGMSQEEVALALGVSRQTVYRWESGTSTPSVENLSSLCGLFGVTMDALYGGRETPAETAPAPEPAPEPMPPEPLPEPVPPAPQAGVRWKIAILAALAAAILAAGIVIGAAFSWGRENKDDSVPVGDLESEVVDENNIIDVSLVPTDVDVVD